MSKINFIQHLCLLTSLGTSLISQEKPIHSFEEKSVPKFIRTTEAATLTFSHDFAQHGSTSLKWNWTKSQPLELDVSSKETANNFLTWIYSSRPQGSIDIQWGHNQKVTYHLNFTGWRSLWIRLNKDGFPKVESNQLENIVPRKKITFKPSNVSGEIYFDLLEINESGIPHDRVGNAQMPYVVNEPTRHNYPWTAKQFKLTEKLPEASQENLDHYQRIKETIDKIYHPENFARWGKAILGYKKLMAKTKIVDDKVIGPHVSTHIVERYYRQKGHEGIHMGSIQAGLYYMAVKFKETDDEKWKNLYFKYLDFQYKKGFADGSGMMNLVFAAKNCGNFIASLLIMRPYFEKEIWDREAATLRWICGYDNLYNPLKEPVDADKVLGDLQSLLLAIHFKPESTDAEKMEKLYDYVQLSKILKVTMEPGIPSDERLFRIVRPDYSIYHHGQEMIFGYGYPAALNYIKFAYIFRKSPAQLDENIIDNLLSIFPKYLTPAGSGPITGNRGLAAASLSSYGQMLNYASAMDNKKAQTWLKYFHANGAISDDSLLFDNKEKIVHSAYQLSPNSVSGNWVQPYAAMQAHKRDDWLAVIRGVNQSTPSPEMFGNPNRENCANIFGDQQGQGFLQLIGKDGVKSSGIDLNQGGWDWSMYPGATTVRLSHEALKNMRNGKVKPKSRTLSGGLSHFNTDGLFYQRLYSNEKTVLEGIDGHKSYFFFDDVIICLGSDLKNPVKGTPMATSLFQHGVNKQSLQPLILNIDDKSKAQIMPKSQPEQQFIDSNINLMDPAGHVYHIPKANKLILRSGLQESPFHRRPFKITKGNYYNAWIDHGNDSIDGQYEYAIKVNGRESQMSRFRKEGLYNILQKDNSAHIIKHLPKNIHAAVFTKAAQNNPHGPVLSTSKPVLVMAETLENTVKISVSDPDPAIDKTDRTVTHIITIKGHWISHEIQSFYEGDNTVLIISITDGQTENITLSKASNNIVAK